MEKEYLWRKRQREEMEKRRRREQIPKEGMWFPVIFVVAIEFVLLLMIWTIFSKSPAASSIKIQALIEMIVFYGVLSIFVVWYLRWNIKNRILIGGLILLGLRVISAFGLQEYIRGKFPFWKISLAIAVVVMLLTVFLEWKDVIILEDNRLSERIFFPFVIGMIVFAVTAFSLANVNWIFDASKGESYYVTVTEKKTTSHKARVNYYIIGEVQNPAKDELQISVSKQEYNLMNVGDVMILSYYEGFLGEPYYY